MDEYLSQGELNIVGGHYVQTTFQTMVDSGLFNLYPHMRSPDDNARWIDSLWLLRESTNNYGTHITRTHGDVRDAIIVAQWCFGDRWALPIVAMLLALKCRKADDRDIAEAIIALFSSKFIALLSYSC